MSLRDIGLALARRAPFLEQLARKAYSRLPSILQDTPTSRALGFFRREVQVQCVEIGAHDGTSGDPLFPLLSACPGWRAVLVEPQPHFFSRLQANYAGRPGLTFLNVAISDFSGQREFYLISLEEARRLGLPHWCNEIASFNRDHVQDAFPEAEVDACTIPVWTFAEAAAHLPDSRADLVILDVEGHEQTILKSMDFDRHKVRFIIFEFKHLGGSLAEIERLLRSHGFRLKYFGRDAIAWRSLGI